MASRKETVDHFLHQLSGAGDVSAKAMFGEYSLYCDGKLFALVCDDTLFIKPTDQGREFAGKIAEASPYPGAKPCLTPSAKQLKDSDWLCELVRITTKALPAPKPKTPKKKK